MDRTEYIHSIKGRNHEWFKRFAKVFRFSIEQEPKTKVISKSEAINFRSSLLSKLREEKRRRFQSNIILKIDFFLSQSNDPPALQNLVKNYLDLMHKEMPGIDELSKILFNDDDQIKILIANYHLNSDKPKIEIQAFNLNMFIQDIELASFIQTNFSDEEEPFRYDLTDDLEQYVDEKDLWYKSHRKQQIQSDYFELNKLSVSQIILMYQVSFDRHRNHDFLKSFQKILNLNIEPIMFSVGSINIGESPYKSGSGNDFKKNIRTKIDDFKRKFPILVPLMHPIGITVFYTPSELNSMDLDNLVRYIAPILTEILDPPSGYVYPQNILEIIPDFKLPKNLKNKILNYQVITRPRLESTPVGGQISFMITNGNSYWDNIWDTVNSLNFKLDNYD